jgi:anhydro-N-acetylmuramic acid kinase
MLCIGLMSGTSMDGIDAALIETDGNLYIKRIAGYSLNYSESFKIAIRKAEIEVRQAKKNIACAEIIKESTLLHAQAVLQLLKKVNLSFQDIDLIGYHGQSLYHNPKEQVTIQIGDGQLLANLTKIKTINNFRQLDILNGGQGAPLAPLYHKALAHGLGLVKITIANCGGIANVTIINNDAVKGFDTGPGNVLLDRLVRVRTCNKEFCDFDGKFSLKGNVNEHELARLVKLFDHYLTKTPPKSLDTGDFLSAYDLNNLSIEDAAATYVNFTAYCIVNSISDNDLTPIWVLAGGGWKNPSIIKALQHYLHQRNTNIIIKTADEMGLDSTFMEAEIFAYLAARSYLNLPVTLASVTGAKSNSKGGDLYLPNNNHKI